MVKHLRHQMSRSLEMLMRWFCLKAVMVELILAVVCRRSHWRCGSMAGSAGSSSGHNGHGGNMKGNKNYSRSARIGRAASSKSPVLAAVRAMHPGLLGLSAGLSVGCVGARKNSRTDSNVRLAKSVSIVDSKEVVQKYLCLQ